jgi:hypothetical protein
MGFSVNGQGGPNWGQTVAQHYEALLKANPTFGFNTTIQYANPAHMVQDKFTRQVYFTPSAIDDAMDYSATHIADFDQNGDGALNLNEYATAMGLSPDVFERPDRTLQEHLMTPHVVQQFNTLDRNHNGQLGVPEAAAYALLQDDGATILRTTLRQVGQGAAADQLDAIGQQLQRENSDPRPLGADGHITPPEQVLTELGLTKAPTHTGQILDGMLSASPLNLSAHYQQYAQRRASFQQPLALS